MTVAEAAIRLHCSANLIYRLCEQGKIAHYRIGFARGLIRIDDADLQAYIDSTRAEAESTGEPTAKSVPRMVGTKIAVPRIIEEYRDQKRRRARRT